MQALFLPATRSAAPPPSTAFRTAAKSSPLPRSPNFVRVLSPSVSLSSPPFPSLSPLSVTALVRHRLSPKTAPFVAAASAGYTTPADESELAKLALVAKRLEKTARYFKRLGAFGFWGQLVCTLVSAVILSFSVAITGKITSPATFYSTAGGIALAFISVFWSFGYLRLSERLRKTANDPSKAPPRADVVASLKNGIVVNVLGMGSAILGLQATVGVLVAKALTTSTTPYYQGGSSPVLALDVFLVQASANTILSHFLGLASSLELLRSVTVPQATPVAKVA